MNEKGFATIFGLCLILAFVLFIKGIQESEMNNSYSTANFKTELDLQNAADSGIYEVAELIRYNININGKNKIYDILPLKVTWKRREVSQKLVIPGKKFESPSDSTPSDSTPSDSITVRVWDERSKVLHWQRSYSPYEKKRLYDKNDEKDIYLLFSVAELEDKHTGEKKYRRSFAYIFADDSRWTIHFAESSTTKD